MTVPDTTPEELERVLAAAAQAAGPLAALRPAERAALLRAAADALDAAAGELVPIAIEESSLPEGRLTGEVARSSGQLRLFADALEEGSYLEVTLDSADANAKPVPRPDLRRMLLPLGPVAVFAASNFPFAFSVPGGDTASALAAGCPVVLKAHPGHPRLSVRTGEVLVEALRAAGAPDGTFAVVHGMDAGATVLTDPRIKAGAFTGSVKGGLALLDIATKRAEPIPFYGELGSLNPVFVTPAAVSARGADIADGYVGSFTLGTGQFCTKPGLLFLPEGHGLEERLTEAVRNAAPAGMLNDRIREGHAHERDRLEGLGPVRTLVHGADTDAGVAPTLLATTAKELLADPDAMLQECFGPTSIVVEYSDPDEMLAAAEAFGGNLTATVQAEDSDAATLAPLLDALRDRAGRLVYNGWPTGVAVSWAMHHGGPFPSTTASIHTSVGVTALRRFLRPVCYQNTPQSLLPEALQDGNPLGLPRRLDGVLTGA
ncbi:aldehyde dehydrogenase (NADP(+)) [Pseudonocardia kunmingensis]|uniref:NADP-dependent aldehyde dehydrogenase n=1 Tax=Pseudonocardia kunmingensis TaxID=630975 RepID=A0A543DJ65_9PSEU|nr:aldehyde dehydrogenase (NADP(+)) [Pseudonocardia kunmingensis]TQM09377.1 NADP-dependent aldehyde dehydrogenase [Pseudonocardia kunmingensis]